MSENDNQQPPAPSKQTSSVPLKKETVRVTLKAADAPPSVPSASVPLAPPVKPPVPTAAPPVATVPSAPKAPPAATTPLRPPGAPVTAGAPTIRLATSTAPVGAPTIALKTGGGALGTSAPPIGAPTIPLKTAGSPSPSVSLPKATVQLTQPTLPIGSQSPSKMATLQLDEEDEGGEHAGLINGLAILSFVAAAAVLVIQLMIADVWINAEDTQSTSGWAQLIE